MARRKLWVDDATKNKDLSGKIYLWSINTYMGVIIGLTIIVILTAILITYMNNHA